MERPFLGRTKWRLERDAQIGAEIKEYLSAIEKVYPILERYSRSKKKLPDDIELPEKPPLLTWLDKVELWGFMEPGTYLDQPAVFMEDIEAAKRARDRYFREKTESKKVEMGAAAAFATAPRPQPLVG